MKKPYAWHDHQLQMVNRLVRPQVVPAVTVVDASSLFSAATVQALEAKKKHLAANPLIIRPRW